MREITEMFAPMYVDGALPAGMEFDVVRCGEFSRSGDGPESSPC